MFIQINPNELQAICNIAKKKGLTEVVMYKDIQNAFYGQYMDSIAMEQYTSEWKDTLHEVLQSVLYVMSREANLIKSNGLKPTFVFYTDKGRNFFNEQIVPTWKDSRKKAILSEKEKNPVGYASHSFMHQMFIKGFNIIEKIFSYLPNTYFYRLENIDSDYVPYLHKYMFPNSYHVITSTDKDYIHMIAEDPNVIRYYFLSKNRHLETKENGWRYLFPKDAYSEMQRKILFYNYQIFHALAGDGSDDMPSLIRMMGFKKWLKKLQGKMDENSMIEFRQAVIDDVPFSSELERPVQKQYSVPVKTFWDLYKFRQYVVDFWITTLVTLPPDKVRTEDETVRNKLTERIFFANEILTNTRNIINKVINKDQIITISEFEHVLDEIKIDRAIAPIIYQGG